MPRIHFGYWMELGHPRAFCLFRIPVELPRRGTTNENRSKVSTNGRMVSAGGSAGGVVDGGRAGSGPDEQRHYFEYLAAGRKHGRCIQRDADGDRRIGTL